MGEPRLQDTTTHTKDIIPQRTKGKPNGSTANTWAGFPQIKKIVVEREKEGILNQYVGAGYGIE